MIPSFYTSTQASYTSLQEGDSFLNSQNLELVSNLPKNDLYQGAVGGFVMTMDDDGLAMIHKNSVGGSSKYDREKSGAQEEIYIVREGDTVSEIAERIYGISPNTIVWANDLGKYIYEGQHLVILPFTGVRHQIKKNDTLSGIADEYGVSVEEIKDFNNIFDSGNLVVGNFLDVPGGVKKEKKPAQPERREVSPTPSPTYVQHTNQSVSAASGYFMRPVRGGIRTQGLHGRNAVDIAAPVGTPIYAAADGQVRVSGWHSNTGYGYYIVVDHPNGASTLYAHNSRNLVGVGQWVSKGDIIAEMGSTGFSTGPHLHFEVHGAANPF